MNIFKKFYCRTYQFLIFIAQRFLSIKEPILISNNDSTYEVGKLLKQKNINNILLVSDESITKLGLLDRLIEGLKDNNIDYVLYNKIQSNPTIDNVEDGLKIYKDNHLDAIVCLGGGSVIDTSKMIGVRANNNKPISKFKGILKVHHSMPLLIAIPTTAGTGSETTLASVIRDEKTNDKYAINDPHLIPKYAFHDPKLLINLPSKITSTTGMDALTHAIESYIGRSNTKKTKKCALTAIKLIHENLYESYINPTNLEARKNMLNASFLAGVAFTNAYVGYVHALSHAISGKFNTPHGLANSIILPYVLKAFGKSIYRKCGQIYDYIELGDKSKNNEQKTNELINYIIHLNEIMNIPNKFDIEVTKIEFDNLINHAYKEANPLYPVPKLFDKSELSNILIQVIKVKGN